MNHFLLLLQAIFFFGILALAVAGIVSAYREDDPKLILKGTFRRFGKFSGFTALIVGGMYLFELAVLGTGF